MVRSGATDWRCSKTVSRGNDSTSLISSANILRPSSGFSCGHHGKGEGTGEGEGEGEGKGDLLVKS